jgi:hypothetical protein
MGRAGGWPKIFGASSLIALVALASLFLLSCAERGVSSSQDEVKVRLAKLYNLYRAYEEKNRKPPSSEEALREFGKALSPQERADRSIGDDLESIFVSPRDKQNFVVQYNLKMNPAKNQALAWEATGQNGMRFVALTMGGYIAEYDDKTLNESKK